ncbi:membrane-bound lytic murein transglycosylase B [Kinneretia asaccharophila]|uniref:Membrane-bound lytic murein transglycosylase B n=2 Tax=Roseateles asaccharophilus TaxID=582607 RepID=A0ABU2A834_9BURK|nr:lytic murein transglycosylase B [Roseateles asaccharophilus]MDR7332193.1 membrane-bound lytic murein transglycosylase B [Roseateles asaccharophilus]
MTFRILPLLASLLMLASPAADAAKKTKPRPPAKVEAPQPLGARAEVLAFADELAAAQGWDAAALREQLTQALDLPRVKQLILPAAVGTAKNWTAYRDRFIEPKRLDAGLAFWTEHEAALTRAENQYGVPPEIVVGIVGVETFYGRIMGGFKVLDALATLAFDFPTAHPRAAERQAFFRKELAEFLKLCRENGLDAAAVQGSYAGALGWPQFMPGSWRQHAVDFDGDGHIDLMASPTDAIGSVAHYLSQYGWKPGQATHYSVTLPPDRQQRARLLAPDIKPTFNAADLLAAGALPSEAARDHVGPMAVIELQNGPKKPTSVLLGTENFWVVTRYNWSAYYALAVIELGQAVKARRLQQARAPSAPG